MSGDNIRVCLRFRPDNKVEKREGENPDAVPLLIVNNTTMKVKGKDMFFDGVMDNTTTQDESFVYVAQPACDDVLNGFNATIFVYGQTGSGKTYTMYGGNDDDIATMGVIPRAMSYIFEHLQQENEDRQVIDFKVEVSFVEIYNEQLKDCLLNKREKKNAPKLKIRLNAKKETYVDGLTKMEVKDVTTVLSLIKLAESNRTTEGTNMNAVSSRGHLLMQISLWQKIRDGNHEITQIGNANFADLAGSEKIKKTGATGQRLKEAQNINLSLTVLGRVINSLSSAKKKVCPYRESKLTHILKDALGGNSKTTLVIAASTHSYNRDETINTLKFGSRCKQIKTKAKVNRIYTQNELLARVSELEAENAELRKLKGIEKQEFHDAGLKTTSDEEIEALKQQLDDWQFAYNAERNKVELAEKRLGFELIKLDQKSEKLDKKIKDLRKVVKRLDEKANERKGDVEKELALTGVDDVELKFKTNYLKQAVQKLVVLKYKNKMLAKLRSRKKKVKPKDVKFWCWMNRDENNGYTRYSEALSDYIDALKEGKEQNVRINDNFYVFCKTGKKRGYAEQVKSQIILDIRRVNEAKFDKLNKEFQGKEPEKLKRSKTIR